MRIPYSLFLFQDYQFSTRELNGWTNSSTYTPRRWCSSRCIVEIRNLCREQSPFDIPAIFCFRSLKVCILSLLKGKSKSWTRRTGKETVDTGDTPYGCSVCTHIRPSAPKPHPSYLYDFTPSKKGHYVSSSFVRLTLVERHDPHFLLSSPPDTRTFRSISLGFPCLQFPVYIYGFTHKVKSPSLTKLLSSLPLP